MTKPAREFVEGHSLSHFKDQLDEEGILARQPLRFHGASRTFTEPVHEFGQFSRVERWHGKTSNVDRAIEAVLKFLTLLGWPAGHDRNIRNVHLQLALKLSIPRVPVTHRVKVVHQKNEPPLPATVL